MKKTLALLPFLGTLTLFAQPSIEWSNTFGSPGLDVAKSFDLTNDGGCIILGETHSSGGDVSNNFGSIDYWLTKFNENGQLEWEQSYGGSLNDWGTSVIQTVSGLYVIGGSTNSDDGQISNSYDFNDAWCLHLGPTGTPLWERSYGGNKTDLLTSIDQALDGNLYIGIQSGSDDIDVSNNYGGWDYWIVKADINSGAIIWEKSIGGSQNDRIKKVLATGDGGCVAIGSSLSSDFDVPQNLGDDDVFIVKLAANGVIEWTKIIGGSAHETTSAILENPDGDLVIVLSTLSTDGDFQNAQMGQDLWLFELDSIGTVKWKKNYGGSDTDVINEISKTQDGGYLLSGYSFSNDGNISSNYGDADALIIKVDISGNFQWALTFGGSDSDGSIGSGRLNNGSYLIGGSTRSDDFDVPFLDGLGDYWLIKLNSDLSLAEEYFDNYLNWDANNNSFVVLNESVTSVELIGQDGKSVYNFDKVSTNQSYPLPSNYIGSFFLRINTRMDINFTRPIVLFN